MTDKQIFTWLQSKRNGAHIQWVSLPKLIRELDALIFADYENTHLTISKDRRNWEWAQTKIQHLRNQLDVMTDILHQNGIRVDLDSVQDEHEP